MRSAMIFLGLVLTQIICAFAQAPLPTIEYPFEQRILLQPNALNFDAPEVSKGDGFLWIVSVGHADTPPAFGGHFCGGSLIAPKWVLTAAHCVLYPPPIDERTIQVTFGYELDKPGKIFRVEKIIVHNDYSITAFNTLLNDIALLKLASAATNYPLVQMLKPSDVAYIRQGVYVMGWGKPSASKNYISNRLRYLQLKQLANDQCNGKDYYNGLVDERMVCALGNGVDACQGDSGGPLLGFDDLQHYFLFGVVSAGEQCGETQKPGIYVRVPSYYTWVQSQIDGD